MNGTILIVDDEQHITKALQRELRTEDCTIFRAHSASEALDILANLTIDVVISDQRMPITTGSELLSQIQVDYPSSSVRILLSGQADIQDIADAINNGGIYKFWTKPWDSTSMRLQVRDACNEAKRIQREKQYRAMLESTIEGMVITNLAGDIELVNAVIEKMTGYDRSTLIGKNYFHDCLHNTDPEALTNVIDAIRKSGQWQGEMLALKKDGSQFLQKLLIHGLPNELNEIMYLGVYCTDTCTEVQVRLNSHPLAGSAYQDYSALNLSLEKCG